jgi:hypothetical protein
MESEPTHPTPTSATDAATALAAIDEAGAAVAERLITPWWYHPIYAALTGLIVASMGMPRGVGTGAVVTGAIGLPVLLTVYRNHTGLGTVTGYGFAVLKWMVLVVVAMLTAAVVVLIARRPWVTVSATAAFMPVAFIAGRCVDNALRASLRRRLAPLR